MPVIVCPQCGFNIQDERTRVGFRVACRRCGLVLEVGGTPAGHSESRSQGAAAASRAGANYEAIRTRPSERRRVDSNPPAIRYITRPTTSNRRVQPRGIKVSHGVIAVVGGAILVIIAGVVEKIETRNAEFIPIETRHPEFFLAPTPRENFSHEEARRRQALDSLAGDADEELVNRLETMWGGHYWQSLDKVERSNLLTEMFETIALEVENYSDRLATQDLLLDSIASW